MRLSSSVKNKKMQRDRGDALLHVAVEFGDGRVLRIPGIGQARIRDQPAEQILDRLVAPHRFGERLSAMRAAGEFFEPALIGLLERDALGFGAVEIGLELRRIDRGIEIGEIPFRQRTEIRRYQCFLTRLYGGFLQLRGRGGTTWGGYGSLLVSKPLSYRVPEPASQPHRRKNVIFPAGRALKMRHIRVVSARPAAPHTTAAMHIIPTRRSA